MKTFNPIIQLLAEDSTTVTEANTVVILFSLNCHNSLHHASHFFIVSLFFIKLTFRPMSRRTKNQKLKVRIEVEKKFRFRNPIVVQVRANAFVR